MLYILLFAIVGVSLARPNAGISRDPDQPSYDVFSDSMARNKFLVLSAAAYPESAQQCLTNKNMGQVDRTVTVQCDFMKDDQCRAYTAVSHADKAIIISFRGTAGTTQLLAEIGEAVFNQMVLFPSGGKISKYFSDAFTLLWTGGIKESVIRLTGQYPDYAVWVTGHSLGGSLASVCASFIASVDIAPSSHVVLYTFGQPRTGDKDYAHSAEALVPNAFRVTHFRDIVPHIPLELMDYWHHETEIFYANDMNPGDAYKTCVGEESNKCSDGYLDISIDDHLTYYGTRISDYGEAGCQ